MSERERERKKKRYQYVLTIDVPRMGCFLVYLLLITYYCCMYEYVLTYDRRPTWRRVDSSSRTAAAGGHYVVDAAVCLTNQHQSVWYYSYCTVVLVQPTTTYCSRVYILPYCIVKALSERTKASMGLELYAPACQVPSTTARHFRPDKGGVVFFLRPSGCVYLSLAPAHPRATKI